MSMTTTSDAFRSAGAEIISKDFGEEVVVANMNTGIFYSLNASAGLVWLDILAGRTLRDITKSFGEDHGDEIRTFVDMLKAEQLIAPTDAPDATTADPTERRVFAGLAFERFEDLQSLLLIDPIHEVSEQGWPLLG